MSWWIRLEDEEGKAGEVDRFFEGGTYAFQGTTETELNVTYNYGSKFKFKNLTGQSGEETIELLTEAVEKLGTERSTNYWDDDPGNVGTACALLLKWAKQFPKMKWSVS